MVLTAAQNSGALDGWWYMRKHPFRLRYRADAPACEVTALLDDLVHEGLLMRWSLGIY